MNYRINFDYFIKYANTLFILDSDMGIFDTFNYWKGDGNFCKKRWEWTDEDLEYEGTADSQEDNDEDEIALAIPKSVTLTTPSSVKRIFCGFMSKCIIRLF